MADKKFDPEGFQEYEWTPPDEKDVEYGGYLPTREEIADAKKKIVEDHLRHLANPNYRVRR